MAGRKKEQEPPTEAVQQLLTPEKVAVLMDCSYDFVMGLIRRRELAAVRLGKLVKIQPKTLQAYLDKLEQGGGL